MTTDWPPSAYSLIANLTSYFAANISMRTFLATNVSLLPTFPKFLKAYLYRCLSRTYFEIVDFFGKYRKPQ